MLTHLSNPELIFLLSLPVVLYMTLAFGLFFFCSIFADLVQSVVTDKTNSSLPAPH